MGVASLIKTDACFQANNEEIDFPRFFSQFAQTNDMLEETQSCPTLLGSEYLTGTRFQSDPPLSPRLYFFNHFAFVIVSGANEKSTRNPI